MPGGRATRGSIDLPAADALKIKRGRIGRNGRVDPTLPRRDARGKRGYAMDFADATGAAAIMDRSIIADPLASLPDATMDPAGFKDAMGHFGDAAGGDWSDHLALDPTDTTGYDYQFNAGMGGTYVHPMRTRRKGGAAPADISLIPTSTINPNRPRTVAAGFDEERGVITIVFRDNTFYNYYSCDEGDWLQFATAHSKGGPAGPIMKFLDHKPRGQANMSAVPHYARRGLYRIAKTGQWVHDGKLAGQFDRSV
jgi:hypothetical protein